MHTFLIVIIVYGGFGFISATIPTSTIDSDLSEINKLSEDLRKFSPDIARQLIEATCQMISQCCPKIKSTFVSMALSGDKQELTDKCFGKKDSSNFLLNVLSCSPLIKMTKIAMDPQITKYMLIMTHKSNQDTEDTKMILDTCTEEEVYSVACDWNRSDLQDTCQRKVLEKLAEQDDQIYKDKVQQTKEGYTKVIDELKKEFDN